jgi:hypothetical protein
MKKRRKALHCKVFRRFLLSGIRISLLYRKEGPALEESIVILPRLQTDFKLPE